MNISITIIFIFITFSSFGQNEGESSERIVYGRIGELTDQQLNSSGPTKLMFVETSDKARNLAKHDIKNGTPFLLLQGGLAPAIIATDPEFEKKYDVYFYEYGCTGPDNGIVKEYNQVIFGYLTQKFGKKWIKQVRKDVVGLKEWRKN